MFGEKFAFRPELRLAVMAHDVIQMNSALAKGFACRSGLNFVLTDTGARPDSTALAQPVAGNTRRPLAADCAVQAGGSALAVALIVFRLALNFVPQLAFGAALTPIVRMFPDNVLLLAGKNAAVVHLARQIKCALRKTQISNVVLLVNQYFAAVFAVALNFNAFTRAAGIFVFRPAPHIAMAEANKNGVQWEPVAGAVYAFQYGWTNALTEVTVRADICALKAIRRAVRLEQLRAMTDVVQLALLAPHLMMSHIAFLLTLKYVGHPLAIQFVLWELFAKAMVFA